MVWWVCRFDTLGKLVSAHRAGVTPPQGGGSPLGDGWVRRLQSPVRPRPPRTARGGHTLHGGCASVHGVQRPISPQVLTKVSRPPSLCRLCTAAVFLGLINTCCNRNAPAWCVQWDHQGPEFRTWSGSGPKCQKWSGIGPELVTRSGFLLGCLWYDLINTYHMICGSYCSAEESKR